MEPVIDAIATFRLAHLLAADVILDGPRTAFMDWAYKNKHAKLRYLATCPWCISMYVAPFVVVARRHRGWDPIARTLAFSAAAGIIHSLLER